MNYLFGNSPGKQVASATPPVGNPEIANAPVVQNTNPPMSEFRNYGNVHQLNPVGYEPAPVLPLFNDPGQHYAQIARDSPNSIFNISELTIEEKARRYDEMQNIINKK